MDSNRLRRCVILDVRLRKMEDDATIRQILIDSCHSSQEAQDLLDSRISDPEFLAKLIEIAEDSEDYQGDAPMQAAYYASKASAAMLINHIEALIRMFPEVNGYGGHVALAIGKTRSPEGRELIEQELGDGSRFDAWLFEKALAEYAPNQAEQDEALNP